MPGRRVCPIRNVQSWIATSDRPVLTSEHGSAPATARVLAQCHDRQDADDPDDDDAGLEQAGRDEAESDTFVLPLQDGEEGNPGPDDGERDDQLEDGGPKDARAVACARDEVRVIERRPVEHDGRDRQVGDEIEQARNECGLAKRGHGVGPFLLIPPRRREPLPWLARPSGMTVVG